MTATARNHLERTHVGPHWFAWYALALLAACAQDESAKKIAVGSAALGEEPEQPPEREIAIVLDGGGGMGPRCEWDPDSWIYTDDGTPLRPTRTLCTPFDGFERQRDALIDAIKEHVKPDGTVALTVVQSANRLRQNPDGPEPWRYDGPIVIVPYRVIRSEADLNIVIEQLELAQIAEDEHHGGSWPGGRCFSYDHSTGKCYGTASHPWAAKVAWDQVLSQCEQSPLDAGTAIAATGCTPRGQSQEICMLGNLAHTVPPVEFWTQLAVVDSSGSESDEFVAGIPPEAYSFAPWSTLADPEIDRFTAINYTPGVTVPWLQGADQATLDAYRQALSPPTWGATLRFRGEALQPGTIRIEFKLVEPTADAIPVQVDRPNLPETHAVDVYVDAGMTAEEVAEHVSNTIAAAAVDVPHSIPIVHSFAAGEVHFFRADSYFVWTDAEHHVPYIEVQPNVEGLAVLLLGNSHKRPERTIEKQDVNVRAAYMPWVRISRDVITRFAVT